jgi:hypothetical protein
MRRSPYMLLVCLYFCLLSLHAHAGNNQRFIRVNILPPEAGIAAPVALPAAAPAEPAEEVSFDQPADRYRMRVRAPRVSQPGFAVKPVQKCKVPVCQPGSFCAPAAPTYGPPCILPRRMPGQIELAVQTFFANIRGKIRYPATVAGIPATEIDFADDLGLPRYQVLLEYSARCQFRPNWSLSYSIMPIHLEATHTTHRTLYFGPFFVIGPFTATRTTWDFTYQRVNLVYQAISGCNASASVYAGWLFNEQRLQMGSTVCAGRCVTVDRTRNMATSGIEIQKCIRTLCNGGTLSCDTRVGFGYLDGAFGLDVQAGLQFSVPLNCGRYGYAKGGYRVLNLKEDRDDLRLDAFFEGGFAEMGIVF